MAEHEDEKTVTEYMAERSDAWKMARSMLRTSDLTYRVDDVLALAQWISDGGYLGNDD